MDSTHRTQESATACAVAETRPAGEDAASRSWRVFPAGSNGEFGLPADLSTVIASGAGCVLRDVRGREFLDFSMGWGSVLLGHAHPAVTAAVTKQAALGSNFAYVSAASLALAEEVIRISPACEQVRFCASGSEATMYCLRLARAASGKSRILKFEGAYHGSHEVGTTSCFAKHLYDWPQPEPLSAGQTEDCTQAILVAPFNDLEVTANIIAQHRDDLAAVIVEPLHRCLPPEPGFLAGLRQVCDKHNVLLIFDEVVTGFRLAYGGAQERYGVIPDLVAYGKAFGGGYPIGLFGGRAEIMDLVREQRLGVERYVWTASTLGGNPVSAAASLAALAVLRGEGVYPRLYALGEYLRTAIRRVLRDHGLPAQVIGDGPLAQMVFCASPVQSSRDIWQGNSALGRQVMLELFQRGVFLNPMGTKLYLSLAHDESVCDQFADRLAEVLPIACGRETRAGSKPQ